MTPSLEAFRGGSAGPLGSGRSPSLPLGPGGYKAGDLPPASHPDREHDLPTVVRCPSLRVPPSLITGIIGAGMSTGQPSPTSFDLGLGPTDLKRTSLP